ncbi:DUF3726 domain-containing protein [Planktotalea sp.]|uniref:DUF3726 domain-containing protein n=1 Tax=Planktotalea sp. TaxID=2029877 RepID=UPI003296955D
MRSSNEISGMVLKAARGAGMPLGCAEDLARIAPLLAKDNTLSLIVGLLKVPLDRPVLEEGSLRRGHPVLTAIASLDLAAAGIEARVEDEIDASLAQMMQQVEIPAGPFEVDTAVWDRLNAFAAKMLVPETEASRLAGAGAGLTDND